MNNGCWGAEKAYQRDFFGGRYIGADVPNPPYDKLAELLRRAPASASSAPRSSTTRVRAALACGRPAIVDVHGRSRTRSTASGATPSSTATRREVGDGASVRLHRGRRGLGGRRARRAPERSAAATACCCSRRGGPDRNPWIHIPLGVGKLLTNERYAWKFETEPQPELKGQRVYWPRGKVLGRLERAQRHGLRVGRPGRVRRAGATRGCAGWCFADVLPVLPAPGEQPLLRATPRRGHGGPMRITDRARRDRDALSDALRGGLPRGAASPRRPTTTWRATKACATSSRPRTAAGAGAPRSRYLRAGAQAARTSRSTPTRWSRGCSSRARGDRRGVPARRRAPCAGPGRARGDPVRRRDPVAAAARALGHRRRASGCARSASRWSRTCPRWART